MVKNHLHYIFLKKKGLKNKNKQNRKNSKKGLKKTQKQKEHKKSKKKTNKTEKHLEKKLRKIFKFQIKLYRNRFQLAITILKKFKAFHHLIQFHLIHQRIFSLHPNALAY